MNAFLAYLTSRAPKILQRLLARNPKLWSKLSAVAQEHYLSKEGRYFL